jgi:glycosyltransferase 2 family protein
MTDNVAMRSGSRSAHKGAGKIALAALKIVITGGCFWYLSRQIDAASVAAGMAKMELRWVGLATFLMMMEIPLVGLRWRAVVNEISESGWRAPPGIIILIAAISSFFSQVLPSIAGEGVRSWLLARLGCGWRIGITSVLIDRAVGVGVLFVLTIFILFLPSGIAALGGFRDHVLAVYGTCIAVGVVTLLFLPRIIPVLDRYRYLRWASSLMASVRRVLFGRAAPAILGLGLAVHALTILALWCVGRAQGLTLPLTDAAVLFVVVLGVALVPISIGGWGVRELAIVSLLGRYGLAPEQALLFSVCFGIVLAVSALPGGVAWLFYAGPAPKTAAEVPG